MVLSFAHKYCAKKHVNKAWRERIFSAVRVIEVASVINRKGLARAGSWFMTER